jgi:hypothetical protein
MSDVIGSGEVTLSNNVHQPKQLFNGYDFKGEITRIDETLS